jgi:four helix bundle protein
MAKSYRDLRVWQGARELTVAIYAATKRFPDDERFGLTAQARRAAISIASNVAEGHGRRTPAEFRHFLGMARGSRYELETQLQIATDLGFIPEAGHASLLERTSTLSRMLNKLMAFNEDAR